MDGAVHVASPDTEAFLATVRPRQVVTDPRFRPGDLGGLGVAGDPRGESAYPVRRPSVAATHVRGTNKPVFSLLL